MKKEALKKLKQKLPKDYAKRINDLLTLQNRKTFSVQYINQVMNPNNEQTSLTVLKLAVQVAKTYKEELDALANEINTI